MAVLGAAAGGRIDLAWARSQVRINSSVDMDKLGSDLEKTQAAFSFEGQAKPGPGHCCRARSRACVAHDVRWRYHATPATSCRDSLKLAAYLAHIRPGLAKTGGVFGPHPAGTYSVYAVRRLGRKSSSRFACA